MVLKKLSYLLLSFYCIQAFAEESPLSNSDKYLDTSVIMEKLKKNHTINNQKDPLIIKGALKSLIDDKNNIVNTTVIDSDFSFMEFTFTEKPALKFFKRENLVNISYSISADIGTSPNPVGVMNLISNNTHFKSNSSQQGNIEIFFKYDDDIYYVDRYVRVEEKKEDPLVVLKHFPIKKFFRQGVKFKFEKPTFTEPLKIPERIFLWNEYSSVTFPCYFDNNSFNYTVTEYIVEYTCDKLPNFNDYGGTLKIIFDKTEFL